MKTSMTVALLINLLFSFTVYAEESDWAEFLNKPYSQVRERLISQGWQIVPNQNIDATSRYAESIYEQGYQEVLECISMERDQCQFVLTKNNQHILVTTKEKTLNVESIDVSQ